MHAAEVNRTAEDAKLSTRRVLAFVLMLYPTKRKMAGSVCQATLLLMGLKINYHRVASTLHQNTHIPDRAVE